MSHSGSLAAFDRWTFVPALALLFAGCSSPHAADGGDGASAGPCDPLTPPPTTLQNVLGVGQDGQGTLYVADQPPSPAQTRVLVGTGSGPLVRQQVIGSGSNGTGQYTLSFVAPGAADTSAQALLLDVSGGTATQMALGPADSKSFLGGPGETALTVLDPNTVGGRPITNLPGVVQYVADVSDGSAIVVTSPMEVDSTSDFHLFYGTPPALAERTIVSFNQALSGYPTIVFQIGGVTYTMAISGTFELDGGGGPGPGTLATGSATLTFTLREPPPTALDGFTFTCLSGS
jgi:hypothetical protein